jgi:hypothetical protein
MIKQFTGAVVVEFQCKVTGQFYRVGSEYVSDEERIQFLNDEGYVEGATEVAPLADPDHDDSDDDLDTDLKHVGGGYYELPNGEKVRGKPEALKRLAEIDFRKGGGQ